MKLEIIWNIPAIKTLYVLLYRSEVQNIQTRYSPYAISANYEGYKRYLVFFKQAQLRSTHAWKCVEMKTSVCEADPALLFLQRNGIASKKLKEGSHLSSQA